MARIFNSYDEITRIQLDWTIDQDFRFCGVRWKQEV